MKSLLLFLTLIMFLLNTFYFYTINFPIVQFLGLFFMSFLMYYTKFVFSKKSLISVSIFILFLTTLYISNLYIITYINFPTSLIGLILSLFVYMYMFNISIPLEEIYKNINKIIYILLIFWFIQFFSFYIFNQKIDYFIHIVGYPQRTGIGFENSGTFFRPASLFIEPAMYANTMLLLFYFRMLINHFRFYITDYFILITIILTFSLYGYFSFALVLLFIFLRKIKISRYLLIFAIFIIILYVLLLYIDNPIIYRIFHPLSNQSGEDRLISGVPDFINLNLIHLLFGFGWGNAEHNHFTSGNALYYILFNTGFIGFIGFFSTLFIFLYKFRYGIIGYLVIILSLLNNGSVLTSFLYWSMMAFIIKAYSIQYKLSLKKCRM